MIIKYSARVLIRRALKCTGIIMGFETRQAEFYMYIYKCGYIDRVFLKKIPVVVFFWRGGLVFLFLGFFFVPVKK